MSRHTQILFASVVVAIVAAILLLRAPIIPAVLGGVVAGLLIWYRQKAP